MTGLETAAWFGVVIVGVGGSALCSGTEIGFYSVNRVRLHVRAAGGAKDAGAELLRREIEHPSGSLATLLISNTFFNNLGAIGISALLAGAGYGEIAVIVLNALILTPLLFVFAEMLPKELFRAEADRVMPRLARPLVWARRLLTVVPLVPAVRFFVAVTSRLVRVSPDRSLVGAKDRIAAMLKEGVRHGVLSEVQTTLLDRALTLDHTNVGDEMVPWAQVRTINQDWPRSRILSFIRRHPFSRFPVVDRRGVVVGVVEQLDLCLKPQAHLKELLSKPPELSPDSPVSDGLVRLRTENASLAVVGSLTSPLGIVTAKDLVEPLTGELLAW